MLLGSQSVKEIFLSLGIGAAGGYVFFRWHMPLPWMLGSMIFVSVSAFLGVPVRRYMPLRNIMVAVLGILLGSFFTMEVIKQLTTWGNIALIMLGYVMATTVSSFVIFRWIAGMDRTTAFFSSTPGGLGVMAIAGEQAGGDNQQIPIAHATRVFLVVLVVPVYLAAIGSVDVADARLMFDSSGVYPDNREIVILLICGIAGYWLANRLDLSFSQILGPMILAGFAYASGLVETPLPTLLVMAAQVVIGSAIGAQFRGMRLVSMLRPAISASVVTGVMLVVAVGLARLSAPILDIKEETLLLALAPGGLAEMSLIAISMDADTALIATMHILRITLIVVAGPPLFRIIQKQWHR